MEKIRIGFDVDGIHANWTKAFTSVANSISPKFPILTTHNQIESWDFDWYFSPVEAYVGNRRVDMDFVHERFDSVPDVWVNVEPINAAHLKWLSEMTEKYADIADFTIITARNGPNLASDEIREQTKRWYSNHGVENVNVYVAQEKGRLSAELGLDYFVDDSPRNVYDIMEKSPSTKVYLLKTNYNRHHANNGLAHVTIEKLDDYYKAVADRLDRLLLSGK